VVYVARCLTRRFGTKHVDKADDGRPSDKLISATDCCNKNCCLLCHIDIDDSGRQHIGLLACRTLVNILKKTRILDASDTDRITSRRLGCLRRHRKTSV
jgi:hypothetical protein